MSYSKILRCYARYLNVVDRPSAVGWGNAVQYVCYRAVPRGILCCSDHRNGMCFHCVIRSFCHYLNVLYLSDTSVPDVLLEISTYLPACLSDCLGISPWVKSKVHGLSETNWPSHQITLLPPPLSSRPLQSRQWHLGQLRDLPQTLILLRVLPLSIYPGPPRHLLAPPPATTFMEVPNRIQVHLTPHPSPL